jgi:cell division protein FtsI (penicillin-binding protein 3)
MVGRILMVLALVLAGARLVDVQGFQAGALSAKAEQQRATQVFTPAQRGAIIDRDGVKLAFSIDIKALYAQPKQLRSQWSDPKNASLHKGVGYDQHIQAIADEMARLLGSQVSEPDLLTKLRSNVNFVYLDRTVDPTAAAQITTDFPEIGAEDRSERVYPDGSVGSNIIGLARWQTDSNPAGLKGDVGLESEMDSQLAGRAGMEWVDTQQGNNQVMIPNTVRDAQSAVPGGNVQLTIDSDVQYELQQKLAEYVAKTGAKDGVAVVMDAHTGEVYGLADDESFDPNNPAGATPAQLGDYAVTTPYEPGSVNKIVTAAAAIDEGLVTPTSTVNIPSELRVADRVIHDDWVHPDELYTVTGIFAKSSNIGADELAQQVGPQRYYDMLMKMGLGQPTGVGLPGESGGYVPAIDKWSGSTFGNLPIGQGLSMTVLQMAGMYQAIANDGVRVPPRIIESVTQPDGTVVRTPQPAGVRVVSAQTAQTVRMMMRAVTQQAKTPQGGTGPSAAVPGYQISGKTGTAQQIDPACNCYSTSKNTVTFAGILSADNPRFVVGIMLNQPSDGAEGGQTAAPLFHDIASYLAQRFQLPVSPTQTPYYTLVAQQ